MQIEKSQEMFLADRLFGWWYRIAAPPEVPEEAPLRDRMRVRSGKLTSVIFLVELLITVMNVIMTILDAPFAVPSLIILLSVVVVGVFLNRIGKTTIAGVLVLVFAEVGLMIDILIAPGGLAPLTLSVFDFFITGELIAASLLLPWITLPLTLVNCLFIAGAITFLPKAPTMLEMMHTQGYTVYANPIGIQIMVALITFLWVSSTYKEMKRANSAEEVNKLTTELAIQQQVIYQEKQQLEESIQQIIEVHMQVANGNLHARVPLDQQNVLWSVAGSLNNLLARLQRGRYDTTQLQLHEQALQQLLYNIQAARRDGISLQVYKTGTSLDALITEISRGVAAPRLSQNQPITPPLWSNTEISRDIAAPRLSQNQPITPPSWPNNE